MKPMILPCHFAAAVAVILTILLAGCASQVDPTVANVPASSTLTLSDRAIVPGERIGPVKLGGKIADIVRLFGPGKVTIQAASPPFLLQTWDAIGLWVQFDPGTGNIVWISVDSSGSYPWAKCSTPEGIRLGTSKQDLTSVMGSPERIVTGGGGTSLYYDRRGIRFTVGTAGLLAGTVGSMRVVWPSVPRGDTLIVPGKRISSIEIGMPIDQVLAMLGGGYHRGESSPGFHVYYWPHLGLSMVERKGHVISARAASHNPSDATGIRYATAEGLGRESTTSQVMRVFGELSKGSPALDPEFLTYRSSGIAFAIDANQKVRFIDVFRPETPNSQ